MEEIMEKIKAMSLEEIEANFCKLMQEIMDNGGANSLINDDAGHWAVTGEGMQQCVMDGPQDLTTTFFIEKHRWANSIPEALKIYAEED